MDDTSVTIETDAGHIVWSTESTFIGTSPPAAGPVNSPPRSKRLSRSVAFKAAGAKKEIIFPIFDKIAQLQTNDKWRLVFDNMASSKFPAKMTTIVDRNYDKDSTDPAMKILTLVYKVRKVEKSLEIFNNPPMMSKELKDFIRKNTGNDYDIESDDLQEDPVPVSYVSEAKTHWNKLKPKDRELRLQGFASRYAKDKKLTAEQAEDLETELVLLNISKSLPEEVVRMNESGEVVHIGGLRMDSNGMFSVGRE